MIVRLKRLKQAIATRAYRRRVRRKGPIAAVAPYHGAVIPRPRQEQAPTARHLR